MKIQDIQIGDWVKFPNSVEKVQEISYVDGMGYCASFAASATLFPVKVEKIEPIPITPEILARNFKKDDGWVSGYFLNDNVHIYKENEEEGTWSIEYMELLQIKYVHQLQQAMRLCKIRKDIKL